MKHSPPDDQKKERYGTNKDKTNATYDKHTTKAQRNIATEEPPWNSQ